MPHGLKAMGHLGWCGGAAALAGNQLRQNNCTVEKVTTMKTHKIALLATTFAFALSVLAAGCDRTVSRTESEKVKSDGTVETKKKEITVSPDGTTNRVVEEKKTTPP